MSTELNHENMSDFGVCDLGYMIMGVCMGDIARYLWATTDDLHTALVLGEPMHVI